MVLAAEASFFSGKLRLPYNKRAWVGSENLSRNHAITWLPSWLNFFILPASSYTYWSIPNICFWVGIQHPKAVRNLDFPCCCLLVTIKFKNFEYYNKIEKHFKSSSMYKKAPFWFDKLLIFEDFAMSLCHHIVKEKLFSRL